MFDIDLFIEQCRFPLDRHTNASMQDPNGST